MVEEFVIKKEGRKILKEKICPVCGSTFTTAREDAIYCDSVCRQHAYRQRKK
jgi:ribosomal protein S27AE